MKVLFKNVQHGYFGTWSEDFGWVGRVPRQVPCVTRSIRSLLLGMCGALCLGFLALVLKRFLRFQQTGG